MIVDRWAASRRELHAALRVQFLAQVTPHIVKTKNGDYVQVFRLSGASFESADDIELNNWHERLNVTWRNIASPNVALWIHVVRRRERVLGQALIQGGFAEGLLRKYRTRLAGELLMMNEMYLSVVYRPMAGTDASVLSKTLSMSSQGAASSILDAKDACEKLGQTVEASLARYEPERLGVYQQNGKSFSQVLEFMGTLLNGEWQPMPLPRAPLNQILATTRPMFGTEAIEYRLPTGTRVGAILGIKEYPTPSTVGMYDALLSAPFPFVLTQSFAFLSKGAAQGLLQRQYNRMANVGDFAVSQAEELKEALDALTSNQFVMGDHHFSLQVMADLDDGLEGQARKPRLQRLNDHVALARSLLADCGMTVAREDLALEAAFWAQLPGSFAMRPRKAPITSRNLAAMAPFHNYPTGRATGNHWGDALALLVTSARSPYYFNLHASDPTDPEGGSRKDTGHTFICGPTGSGKTVFIGFMVALLAGQGVTQVIFDKDYGLEILVRALGGQYFPLKNGEPTGLNPLQLEETPLNLDFLRSWLQTLARGTEALSAREVADLDQALRCTLALDRRERRLSRLIEFTDPTHGDGIHARLSRWCYSTEGEYAWAFDNADDQVVAELSRHATIGFDVTHFLKHETLRGPINRYLFHIVEQLIDGRRLVCWVDEFSNALADADFEAFADNAPKTWRKLNGVLSVATQTTGAVLKSRIARTIVEQTATKVFFPNPDASAEDYVAGFGLTQREFKLLKEELEPGARMFLVKQGHWSVVCELNLKGFDAELAVISGRRSTVEQVNQIIAEVGAHPEAWLPVFVAQVSR